MNLEHRPFAANEMTVIRGFYVVRDHHHLSRMHCPESVDPIVYNL